MQLRIFRHECVDSTSERAFAALAEGSARHGDVHVAREQSAGRGRLGRSWHSARGEGLYLSLVLLPAPPPLSPAALTMAGGLAVHDAVLELFRNAGLRAPALHLKWPNDLCAGDAKLAGVLVETRGLDPARPHYVVGIGVNVRQREFPPALLAERAVTSLALSGLDATLASVEEALLAALTRRLEPLAGPSAGLARDFLAATGLQGARVRAELGERSHAGVLLGLDLERGLELELAAGERLHLPLEFVKQVARA